MVVVFVVTVPLVLMRLEGGEAVVVSSGAVDMLLCCLAWFELWKEEVVLVEKAEMLEEWDGMVE